ncbi:glycosyltransferase [Planctomycetota bacterium]
MSRIVYLTWPTGEITGGIKLIFQHVALLTEAGLPAVVASEDAVAPSWFDTSATVISTSDVGNQDVLVFPENHAKLLGNEQFRPNKKVVYCQNQFMAYRGLGSCQDYREHGVCGMLALGRLAADFCRHRFPSLPVISVPAAISDQFGFQSTKTLQIAFAPRKRDFEAAFIHDLFSFRNPRWRDVRWLMIDGQDESVVAQVLKRSAIYLSLQRYESVGISALEAMACGCVVAGFTGQGGREYASGANGFWAEEDDVVECTKQLERGVNCVTSRDSMRVEEVLEAANRTAKYYSTDRLGKRIIPFWRSFLEVGDWPPIDA